MFIQTQDTPSPATLKFIPGVPVMPQGTADFADMNAAKSSPLAQRLFQVDGVTNVFLGADFVAVTKAGSLEWFALKPAILRSRDIGFSYGVIQTAKVRASLLRKRDTKSVNTIFALISH